MAQAADGVKDIETVRALATQYSNWGRWGPDDELGTLNHLTPADVARACALPVKGEVHSLAIPYDSRGPQIGRSDGRRFNPVHLMISDGGDIHDDDAYLRDNRMTKDGSDRYLRATDDLIIMPLQSGTQWDALAHIFFEGRMYNGFPTTDVTSKGARRNDVRRASGTMVGRGVLLDLPRAQGREWLEPGEPIGTAELTACEQAQGVVVGRGDIVLVRTGHLAHSKDGRSWGSYVGGSCPGLGLESVPWIAEREIAAMATDTWPFEVLPNETADVLQPLHIVLISFLGLWIGEMFDLEALAQSCAHDGAYEFLFVGPPLPFTGAVGSPLNPIAIR